MNNVETYSDTLIGELGTIMSDNEINWDSNLTRHYAKTFESPDQPLCEIYTQCDHDCKWWDNTEGCTFNNFNGGE
jgi:hypothetical protein